MVMVGAVEAMAVVGGESGGGSEALSAVLKKKKKKKKKKKVMGAGKETLRREIGAAAGGGVAAVARWCPMSSTFKWTLLLQLNRRQSVDKRRESPCRCDHKRHRGGRFLLRLGCRTRLLLPPLTP